MLDTLSPNAPKRGEARRRLLDAARGLIRERGFTAMTVDDLCARAGVTKGAFFHHFPSKEALGVAAAQDWAAMADALFAEAAYHAPEDPLDRLLAYIAFRRELIAGSAAEFSCVAGALAQEVWETSPAIRDAARDAILGHAVTLEPMIEAAMARHGAPPGFTAQSLARHTQAVLQGGFVLAKATLNPEEARASLDHLDRYVRLLFRREIPSAKGPEDMR
jgi:TetR/AcrR family transcriptional repressor of nem operon